MRGERAPFDDFDFAVRVPGLVSRPEGGDRERDFAFGDREPGDFDPGERRPRGETGERVLGDLRAPGRGPSDREPPFSITAAMALFIATSMVSPFFSAFKSSAVTDDSMKDDVK